MTPGCRAAAGWWGAAPAVKVLRCWPHWTSKCGKLFESGEHASTSAAHVPPPKKIAAAWLPHLLLDHDGHAVVQLDSDLVSGVHGPCNSMQHVAEQPAYGSGYTTRQTSRNSCILTGARIAQHVGAVCHLWNAAGSMRLRSHRSGSSSRRSTGSPSSHLHVEKVGGAWARHEQHASRNSDGRRASQGAGQRSAGTERARF